MIDSISIYACAKINLFLNVLSKLPDGYHSVDNVMQAVSLYDTVVLRPGASGITLDCPDVDLPSPRDNIAWKAAELFMSACPSAADGVDISIKKSIPSAAGLAGGSSDAAAVLVGMNLLFGAGLDEDDLCAIGTRLGMDVPFCVMGGCRRAQGRGEILSPLPPMPKCRILIAIGRDRISTGWAYSQLDSRPFSDTGNRIPDALSSGSLEGICSSMYNCFETLTDTHKEIKRIMLACGALGAMMSGSGPSVFGIFSPGDRGSLDKARMLLAAREYDTYVCEPVI